MKNKTLANWLIATLVALTVGVMYEYEPMGEMLLTLGAIGFWVFSIWTITRLYKLDEK